MKFKSLFIALVFFISNVNAMIQTTCIPEIFTEIETQKDLNKYFDEDYLIYAKCSKNGQKDKFFVLETISDYEKLATDFTTICLYYYED